MKKLARRSVKRNSIKDTADEVADAIESGNTKTSDRSPNISRDPKDCISTSITLLNCALTDNPLAGFPLGRVSMIVGDSSSGKSIILLSVLALACKNPQFDEYDLYYDDAEAAFDFDAEKLFGTAFVERVIPKSSNLAEDFYGHIMQALDSKKPFIYILDSYDSLTCGAELERAEIKRKMAAGEKLTKKEQDSKGGFKTEKVRLFAEVFRRCRNEIATTRSCFIPVFQTIDAINSQFVEKTRRGGNAPKFFSSHEMWLRVVSSIKSKGLEIGVNSEAYVTKNKITGKRRKVTFPIYYDYGIDNLTTNINFLVDQGYFKPVANSLEVPQFGFEKITIDKLIGHIEENNLEGKLDELVGEAWNKREATVEMDRKPRF